MDANHSNNDDACWRAATPLEETTRYWEWKRYLELATGNRLRRFRSKGSYFDSTALVEWSLRFLGRNLLRQAAAERNAPCAYCGHTLLYGLEHQHSTYYATVEHIVPREYLKQHEAYKHRYGFSLGWCHEQIHSVHNYLLVCRDCNRRRSNQPLFSFFEQEGFRPWQHLKQYLKQMVSFELEMRGESRISRMVRYVDAVKRSLRLELTKPMQVTLPILEQPDQQEAA